MLFALLSLVAFQDAPAADPAAKPDKPAKICRVYEITGSRVSKRKICKTREEWNAEDRRAGEGAPNQNGNHGNH